MENIHTRIKELRKSRQLTETQVAHYLGITQQTYSNYELGKHELPSRHVISLAKLYNVSADFILGTEPSHAGTFDLNVNYINGTTLKNIILCIRKYNHRKRLDLLRFLSYLNNIH